MKKFFPVLLALVLVVVIAAFYYVNARPEKVVAPMEESGLPMRKTTTATAGPFGSEGDFVERYTARVDRVDVTFEHKNFTEYRLTTNGLVREGELNTERGFEDDPDATVFVLNWRQPEGEQMYCVRLTAEPGLLYMLDSDRKILRGSVLTFVE